MQLLEDEEGEGDEEDEEVDPLSPEERAKVDTLQEQMELRITEFTDAVQAEMDRESESRKPNRRRKGSRLPKYAPTPKKVKTAKGIEPLEALEWLDRLLECVDDKERSIYANFVLTLNPRNADERVRGTITLPHGTGTSIRIAVCCNAAKTEEARAAGADYVGEEDMIRRIQDGFEDFDKLICTPDMMPKVAMLGRQLGPKGLMPSPKTGTVTNDLRNAIEEYKGGKAEFTMDRESNVRFELGLASMDREKLLDNLSAALQALDASKPPKVTTFDSMYEDIFVEIPDLPSVPVAKLLLKQLVLQRGYTLKDNEATGKKKYLGMDDIEMDLPWSMFDHIGA